MTIAAGLASGEQVVTAGVGLIDPDMAADRLVGAGAMSGQDKERPYNLSAWALRHRALILYVMLAVAAAGVWAYMTLGRGEDPPFTIKTMVMTVDWPGASADEMMREVTDRIERKLEELPSLDYTESTTQPGHAIITITLKDDTPPSDLPNLWYQVRKKIGDIQSDFPAGVQGPYFNDEFGDVFGIVYAFTGDGFTLPQLKHIVEDARERLLSISGIGKIDLFGVQEERIYLDFSYRKLGDSESRRRRSSMSSGARTT